MKTIAIAAGALLLAQGVFAGEVSAQVLEIGDDGVVTTYSGPMVFTNAGAQTLVKASVPVPSLDPARAEVPRLVAEAAARHGERERPQPRDEQPVDRDTPRCA